MVMRVLISIVFVGPYLVEAEVALNAVRCEENFPVAGEDEEEAVESLCRKK
jgi:hypothetical protein